MFSFIVNWAKIYQLLMLRIQILLEAIMYKTSFALALFTGNSTTMHIVVNIYWLVMKMSMTHLFWTGYLFVLLCTEIPSLYKEVPLYFYPMGIWKGWEHKGRATRVTCVLEWIDLFSPTDLDFSRATESNSELPGWGEKGDCVWE